MSDKRQQEGVAAGRGERSGKLARLVEALPPDMRHEFDEIWQVRHVAAGEVLLEEDEKPDHIGYVLDGLLGMVKELADGRRHIIGLLVPTDMYGRAFDGGQGYRIEALAESTVQVCDGARFEQILGRSTEAERLFLVNVLDELDAAREWVLVLSGPKVVQRVASFLLILCRRKLREAERPGAAGGDPFNLHLSIRRNDLAHYLGARPESLSRAFRELERDGIIRINDAYDFDVLDLAALVEIAGHDLVMDGAPD